MCKSREIASIFNTNDVLIFLAHHQLSRLPNAEQKLSVTQAAVACGCCSHSLTRCRNAQLVTGTRASLPHHYATSRVVPVGAAALFKQLVQPRGAHLASLDQNYNLQACLSRLRCKNWCWSGIEKEYFWQNGIWLLVQQDAVFTAGPGLFDLPQISVSLYYEIARNLNVKTVLYYQLSALLAITFSRKRQTHCRNTI
ncbi:hypothetical protein FVE85_9715 [Porphyridium purpureum]|uniref:Uncharacterized protein n=1 Tax=Porphyridium purpureum TaxID=35688 RepID=A0A5J4YK86_PORPP|nr:hypothetical protein FVE85_9715 [Porphyridium purpureum]|eukprot:POR3729..scf246_12